MRLGEVRLVLPTGPQLRLVHQFQGTYLVMTRHEAAPLVALVLVAVLAAVAMTPQVHPVRTAYRRTSCGYPCSLAHLDNPI